MAEKNMLSDILSGIYSGILYDILFWYSFLASTLASILVFYLANIQVSMMAFYLASILTYPASNEIWHPQLTSSSPLSPGARGEGEGNSNKIQRPLPGRWEKMKQFETSP